MRSKIDICRRLNRQHPHDVWLVLNRLRVMDKLQGLEERFFDMRQVAEVLYSNWSELSLLEQERVVFYKLRFSFAFLCHYHYIEEQTETVDNPRIFMRDIEPVIQRSLGLYKARNNIFRQIESLGTEFADESHRSVMDDRWGCWIGRRNATWA